MVAGGAVADASDLAELSGVDVDEFAGPLPLLPDDRRLRGEGCQANEAQPAQYRADGGRGMPSWRASHL